MAPDFTGLTKAVSVNRTCAVPLNELVHSVSASPLGPATDLIVVGLSTHQDVKGTVEGGIMVC